MDTAQSVDFPGFLYYNGDKERQVSEKNRLIKQGDYQHMTSNFEYYKIFYYVAKYGNLTRATAALNTSQPAVTRVIHKLESDLGCRLFIRSKSGMELTAEGSRFFEYVSAGCLQFFRAENHLSDLLQLENGSISISATETDLHSWLFAAMEAFHQEYPGVHFQILNHSTQDSIQAVRDGKVDFAVVSSLPLHISEPLRMKKLHIRSMKRERVQSKRQEQYVLRFQLYRSKDRWLKK